MFRYFIPYQDRFYFHSVMHFGKPFQQYHISFFQTGSDYTVRPINISYFHIPEMYRTIFCYDINIIIALYLVNGLLRNQYGFSVFPYIGTDTSKLSRFKQFIRIREINLHNNRPGLIIDLRLSVFINTGIRVNRIIR